MVGRGRQQVSCIGNVGQQRILEKEATKEEEEQAPQEPQEREQEPVTQ